MKRHYLLTLTAAAVIAVLAGCASAPEESDLAKAGLPDWIVNPTLEDGIASSDCVPWSGNMSLDRAEAVAKARADLAKQIDVKVKAMDKTYGRTIRTAGGVSAGSTFESVSKQVTAKNLSRTQVLKVDMVNVNGKDHLCAMVGFGPAATRELFDQLVKSSSVGQTISPNDEAVLFEEFKAYKAQQELEKETAGM